MKGTVQLFIFMLLFRNIRNESVSSYFSVHENRALSTRSTFIRSTYVKGVMLCARACGTESNCNTANYNTEDNKCDLFKERVEKNSHGAAMITSRGCYLITKVRIFFLYLFNRIITSSMLWLS